MDETFIQLQNKLKKNSTQIQKNWSTK